MNAILWRKIKILAKYMKILYLLILSGILSELQSFSSGFLSKGRIMLLVAGDRKWLG